MAGPEAKDKQPKEAKPPAAAEGAAAGKDLPLSIIKIKDTAGKTHEFDLAKYDSKLGRDLFAVLPEHHQKEALERKKFILNLKHIIKDIPDELQKPGAMQALWEELAKNSGYATEKVSDQVKQWLDGPYGAELRRNGLYKGAKTSADIASLGLNIAEAGKDVLAKYWSTLWLPFRAAGAGLDKLWDKVDTVSNISEDQALAVAAAYQGAMYMATESEKAKSKVDPNDPGVFHEAWAWTQTGWAHFVVFCIAAWNFVRDGLKEDNWDWDKAWDAAEKYWTDGKGIPSQEERKKQNVTRHGKKEAAPKVDGMLRQLKTIDGVDVSPYLDAMKEGTFIQGKDKLVYRMGENGLPEANPVEGPNKKPLTQGDRDNHALNKVNDGIFKDWSPYEMATGTIALSGGALTYRGVGQGMATVYTGGAATSKLEKELKKAKDELGVLQKRFQDALDGKRPDWRLKPEDVTELSDKVKEADKKVSGLQAKVDALPKDRLEVLQRDGNAVQRTAAKLAKEASTKLPEDAKGTEKFSNLLQRAGRPVGEVIMHGATAVKDLAAGVAQGTVNGLAGVVQGTAQSIAPATALAVAGTDKALPINTVAGSLAKVAGENAAGGMGSVGKGLGTVGGWTNKLMLVGSPALNIAKAQGEGDTMGTAIYTTELVGIGSTVYALGGKELTKKAIGAGLRRTVPGLNVGMAAVDLLDGYRKDDGAKTAKAQAELGTMGAGAVIGGILGLFGGPFAALTVPAGAAAGTAIGGWLSIPTGMYAESRYAAKQDEARKQAQQTGAPTGSLPADPALQAAALEAEAARIRAAAKVGQDSPDAVRNLQMAANRGLGGNPMVISAVKVGNVFVLPASLPSNNDAARSMTPALS